MAKRWFTTGAGSADLILAGCLAWRPRFSLLFFFCVIGFVVAALINLSLVPDAVILAAMVPALATYPFWAELRSPGLLPAPLFASHCDHVRL